VKQFAAFADYRDSLQALLEQIYPYPLTYSILERYADLQRKLRPPYGKGLIGDIDTLIAASVLEHDLTLLTIDSAFCAGTSYQMAVGEPQSSIKFFSRRLLAVISMHFSK
jgi:predicted nucleic acid-binding protein